MIQSHSCDLKHRFPVCICFAKTPFDQLVVLFSVATNGTIGILNSGIHNPRTSVLGVCLMFLVNPADTHSERRYCNDRMTVLLQFSYAQIAPLHVQGIHTVAYTMNLQADKSARRHVVLQIGHLLIVDQT